MRLKAGRAGQGRGFTQSIRAVLGRCLKKSLCGSTPRVARTCQCCARPSPVSHASLSRPPLFSRCVPLCPIANVFFGYGLAPVFFCTSDFHLLLWFGFLDYPFDGNAFSAFVFFLLSRQLPRALFCDTKKRWGSFSALGALQSLGWKAGQPGQAALRLAWDSRGSARNGSAPKSTSASSAVTGAQGP